MLPILFASLCRQTDMGFEWIVVDDGSTDGTEQLVREWMAQPHPFDISYYKQKNGGKHRAVNAGVQKAKYDFTMILDSDDYLCDDAVAYVNQWIQSVQDDNSFAGVSGKRYWLNEKMSQLNHADDDTYIDAANTERKRYGIYDDQTEVYKTEILKRFPSPEFEGENFMRESWDRIALAGYKIRWYNRAISNSDYYSDGLTKNVALQVYAKNWQGYTYSVRLFLRTHTIPYSWIKIGQYAQVGKMAGKSSREICKNLNISPFTLLVSKLFSQVNHIRKKLSHQYDPRGV